MRPNDNAPEPGSIEEAMIGIEAMHQLHETLGTLLDGLKTNLTERGWSETMAETAALQMGAIFYNNSIRPKGLFG